MRTVLTLAAVLALSATSAFAATTQCRDAKTKKFIKCPTPAAAPTSTMVKAKCKDGFAWTGKQRAGACSGHKGVASWG